MKDIKIRFETPDWFSNCSIDDIKSVYMGELGYVRIDFLESYPTDGSEATITNGDLDIIIKHKPEIVEEELINLRANVKATAEWLERN